MDSICPVCNALEDWHHACPSCGQPLADMGRLTDCYGPYSAYRSIDAVKMTNGIPDVQAHICCHVGACAACDRTFEIPISEWR